VPARPLIGLVRLDPGRQVRQAAAGARQHGEHALAL